MKKVSAFETSTHWNALIILLISIANSEEKDSILTFTSIISLPVFVNQYFM